MTAAARKLHQMHRGVPSIGALVVGQSPRPEIESEFRHLAGDTAKLVLRGALDGLSRAEIDALVPEDDADTLFTRLPNGDGVKISKQQVIRHGADQLESLHAEGVDVVIMLCTGSFPQWSDRDGVLFPSRTVAAMVSGVLPTGRLGVFSPLQEQCAQSAKRWQEKGYEVVSMALSPNADAEAAKAAATAMAGHAPQLLVMDCISYTRQTKHILSAITGAPAILGVSSAIRSALELVD